MKTYSKLFCVALTLTVLVLSASCQLEESSDKSGEPTSEVKTSAVNIRSVLCTDAGEDSPNNVRPKICRKGENTKAPVVFPTGPRAGVGGLEPRVLRQKRARAASEQPIRSTKATET